MVRQHESQRPDDVGSDLPEDFALDQRLADQPELVVFEIAQAAMHQLGRPRRGAAGQVIHFAEENRVSPAGRIAGDATAIDAAANDREVENLTQGRSPHAFVAHDPGKGTRGCSLVFRFSDWLSFLD